MFNSNVAPKKRPKHTQPKDWYCRCELPSVNPQGNAKRNAYYLASCSTCRTKRP